MNYTQDAGNQTINKHLVSINNVQEFAFVTSIAHQMNLDKFWSGMQKKVCTIEYLSIIIKSHMPIGQ